MEIFEKNIWINNNWICIDGLGKVGLYSVYDKAILLDYSMKWIVGTNDRIPCERYEIKSKILNLFVKK